LDLFPPPENVEKRKQIWVEKRHPLLWLFSRQGKVESKRSKTKEGSPVKRSGIRKKPLICPICVSACQIFTPVVAVPIHPNQPIHPHHPSRKGNTRILVIHK